MCDVKTEPVACAMLTLGNEKFMKHFLQKYCLDKQFVKNIIDEHWNATKDHIPIDGNYLYLIKALKLTQE